MVDGPTLVIVGSSGAVGRAVLQALGTRSLVWGEIRLAASSRHVGQRVSAYGQELVTRAVSPELFAGADVAIIAVPDDVAESVAEMAVAAGVPAVDCSPTFRAAEDVPLVVPEVNPAQIHHRPRGIVASPSASSTAFLTALGPLHQGWGLNRAIVTAMQAVSGYGDAGTAQLVAETDSLAGQRSIGLTPGDIRHLLDLDTVSPFPAPVAANVVPVTSELDSEGWSQQEARMRREARKVLGLPELRMAATTVWVPVLTAHSLSVHATFERKISADEARQTLMEGMNSVVVLDDPENEDWPNPVDVAGSDPTFVGRIRSSPDFPRSLELFVCTDNLRKGAALNMIQIAEAIAQE
ncbi:aspartate-semialdehyde dehydrogenase [Demetria terragena]|uniref:aspartate-semialdehyde dehydrogenase n=1 Tax=Demetria terragena TaxID=63959 RepID=UPI000365D5B9|nr:aspartate-semialdehyde dehydrogenase [Demetria terragena]